MGSSLPHAEAETPVLWPPDAKGWPIWKDPDAGKDWGQEEKDRGWDGWMASLTQWTWVWVDSGSWWWTGRPGVLRFMGSQRVGHNWETELNWTKLTLVQKASFWVKSQGIMPDHNEFSSPRILHFEVYLGWRVNAHQREGPRVGQVWKKKPDNWSEGR